LLLLVAGASSAETFTSLRAAAASAVDRDTLERASQQLADRLGAFGPSTAPRQFEAAGETLGTLVSRARDLGADAALWLELIEQARALRRHVERARFHLEARQGDDEAALERLYRSRDWQRLDYAEVASGYWLGWAQVSLGQALSPGPERRAAMKAAERAFSRASLELGLPRIATLSLLGLGIVRRELGEPERARRSLERFEALLSRQADPELLVPALYELLVIALEDGDLERARALRDRLPPEALPPERELALAKLEARAWLQHAEAGRGGAEQAAALLRHLNAAGGAHAEFATALVLEHRDVLAGLDVGPTGDLVRAEEAFAAGRFAEASEAYAQALSRASELPGVDLELTRYKHAVSLFESDGERELAIRELERVLAGDGDSLRASAVRLLYVLTAAEATQHPSSASEGRALRAAELLLEIDPDSDEAAHARYRIARDRSAGSGRDPMALLEAIPTSSDAYPSACLERARLRAARLQRHANAGRGLGAEMRAEAKKLRTDLETLQALAREGRLSADPARDARLAVLHAKAADWAGEPGSRVLALVEQAERTPQLDDSGRRALLRLRLRTLCNEGLFDALTEFFDATPEAGVRRDWEIWYETLQRAERQRTPRPPSAWLVRMHARLGELAPQAHRDAAALSEAQVLLRSGRAEEAVAKAGPLVEADPGWGNAWVTYARALDASEEAAGARDAWSQVAAGVEEGSPLWFEAQLGIATALHRLGDSPNACRQLEEVRTLESQPSSAKLRSRYDAELARCAARDAERADD
jgi:tetratricopeptide (TPR) repeat protein